MKAEGGEEARFLQQLIELLVGDFRFIVDVVAMIVMVDLTAEFGGALREFRHGTPRLG